jgi:hypothetical protein
MAITVKPSREWVKDLSPPLIAIANLIAAGYIDIAKKAI